MRLQLTRRGDYAVRAMLDLAARPTEMHSGPAIAERTRIPSRFVTQVMGDLTRGGLVLARIGRNGGYQLIGDPRDVSILTIVEAVEGDQRRRRCVLRAEPCSDDGVCRVHEIFAGAHDALLAQLAGATLATALRDER